MEAISKLSDTAIPVVLDPTREAFIPLLAARKTQIDQTPKKTFKFGPTERHQVDIYYPPQGTSNAPILFFVYGGGFTTGSRDPVPGLIYDNLGAFFAQRGILTAIADYRLAPGTTYPGPVQDIRDAIQFTISSPEVDVTGHGADKTSVYIMGHSAGGTHVAALFLDEDILGIQDRSIFKGAVLLGPAYGSLPNFSSYYGEPEEDQAKKCPFGLFNSKSADKIKQLLPPRLFLGVSENDPPGLIAWHETFVKSLVEQGFLAFETYTMMGHNHISPEVSPYSGEGEEWAEQVAKWVNA